MLHASVTIYGTYFPITVEFDRISNHNWIPTGRSCAVDPLFLDDTIKQIMAIYCGLGNAENIKNERNNDKLIVFFVYVWIVDDHLFSLFTGLQKIEKVMLAGCDLEWPKRGFWHFPNLQMAECSNGRNCPKPEQEDLYSRALVSVHFFWFRPISPSNRLAKEGLQGNGENFIIFSKTNSEFSTILI